MWIHSPSFLHFTEHAFGHAIQDALIRWIGVRFRSSSIERGSYGSCNPQAKHVFLSPRSVWLIYFSSHQRQFKVMIEEGILMRVFSTKLVEYSSYKQSRDFGFLQGSFAIFASLMIKMSEMSWTITFSESQVAPKTATIQLGPWDTGAFIHALVWALCSATQDAQRLSSILEVRIQSPHIYVCFGSA